MIKFAIIVSVVLVFIVLLYFGRRAEKLAWNNGFCPKCGSKLVLPGWMVDSQGGRGWTCPSSDCHYTAWVSWRVDKRA